MHIQDVLLNLKAASAGAFARPSIFWFVLASLIAPLALLTLGGSHSNNLPWYFWTTMLAMLLIEACVGFFRFTRPSRGADNISISPDQARRTSPSKDQA